MRPQQRKPPVKRLYRPGLGGVPVIDAALDATNENRRGRPPEYGAAMSPAEQKRRKREEKARRDLMAELLKVYRRMQATPYARTSKEQLAADKAAAQMRRQQQRFFSQLNALPVYELKRLLEAWKETPDAAGRLPGERSGERRNRNGQSEIETITEAQRAEDEGGRKVKPKGHGPYQDGDDDDDAEQLNSEPGRSGQCDSDAANNWQRSLEAKLNLVARLMTKDGVCCVCGSTEGEEHIWKKWYECTSAEAKFLAMHSAGAPDELRIALYERIDHNHLDAIDKMLRKRWATLGYTEDVQPIPHSEQISIDDLIKKGWAFFSTILNKTEVILPSQAVVRSFFGHLEFARKRQSA